MSLIQWSSVNIYINTTGKIGQTNLYSTYIQSVWKCINTHPLIYYSIDNLHSFALRSSAIVLLILTRVHLAYLLYEGLIKTCNYGATYWNHKVLVQALHKGIDSSNTSPLMKDTFKKTQLLDKWRQAQVPLQKWVTSNEWHLPVVWGACIWKTVLRMHCWLCGEYYVWHTQQPAPQAYKPR